MLEELRKRVCDANIKLRDSGLVILTWGNVSAIDREKGLIVIKPSGVPYDELTPENMVIVDMEGNVVEGDLNPSSDTPSHIALYESFQELGGIVHTHSRFATIWAQAGLDITAYGTTHADYFYGDIPCTVPLEEADIINDYERNTGLAIADAFAKRRIDCMDIPACLVAHHGPFTWGENCEKAVENAIVLEEVAHMAVYNSMFQFSLNRIQDALLDKHYLRKHGENAYYGQGNIHIEETDSGEEITIKPTEPTVELKNESVIGSVEPPVVVRPQKREEPVFNIETPDDGNGSSDMSMNEAPLELKEVEPERPAPKAPSGPLNFTF